MPREGSTLIVVDGNCAGDYLRVRWSFIRCMLSSSWVVGMLSRRDVRPGTGAFGGMVPRRYVPAIAASFRDKSMVVETRHHY